MDKSSRTKRRKLKNELDILEQIYSTSGDELINNDEDTSVDDVDTDESFTLSNQTNTVNPNFFNDTAESRQLNSILADINNPSTLCSNYEVCSDDVSTYNLKMYVAFKNKFSIFLNKLYLYCLNQ